jgi:TPR repeat protein
MKLKSHFRRTAGLLLGALACALTAAAPAATLEETRARALTGDAAAELQLAHAYDRGEEVTADAAEATRWFQLAAQHGNAKAQSQLAGRFAAGKGTEKNLAERPIQPRRHARPRHRRHCRHH